VAGITIDGDSVLLKIDNQLICTSTIKKDQNGKMTCEDGKYFKFDHPTYANPGQKFTLDDIHKIAFIQKLEARANQQNWKISAENIESCVMQQMNGTGGARMPAESYAVLCANYEQDSKGALGFHGSFMNTNDRGKKQTTLDLINPPNKQFLQFLKNQNALATAGGQGCSPKLNLQFANCSPFKCDKWSGLNMCRHSGCEHDNEFDLSTVVSRLKDTLTRPVLLKLGIKLSDAQWSNIQNRDPVCIPCPEGSKYDGKNSCVDPHQCPIFTETFNFSANACIPKQCDSGSGLSKGCNPSCESECDWDVEEAHRYLDGYRSNSEDEVLFGDERTAFNQLPAAQKTAFFRVMSQVTSNVLASLQMDQLQCNKDKSMISQCDKEYRKINQAQESFLSKTCQKGEIFRNDECIFSGCDACVQMEDDLFRSRASAMNNDSHFLFKMGYCSTEEREHLIVTYAATLDAELQARLSSCKATHNASICAVPLQLNPQNIITYAGSIDYPCLAKPTSSQGQTIPGVR